MAKSREYTTIINCTEKLEIAFRPVDRSIVHFLHREGFITQEVHDDVLNSTLSDHKKAGELVTGIRNKVELDTKNYHDFVTYLRRSGKQYYRSIVKILDKEYSKQQQTGK